MARKRNSSEQISLGYRPPAPEAIRPVKVEILTSKVVQLNGAGQHYFYLVVLGEYIILF